MVVMFLLRAGESATNVIVSDGVLGKSIHDVIEATSEVQVK